MGLGPGMVDSDRAWVHFQETGYEEGVSVGLKDSEEVSGLTSGLGAMISFATSSSTIDVEAAGGASSVDSD